jgi:hypothetical protein
MRKLVTALASVALVLALGAPAFADNAKSPSPSTNQVTAMRVDHHHGGWHHGDRDDYYRHHDRDDYYGHGYYRHHYYRDGYYYGYPYYYDGYYYDGYYDGYSSRCRWAYYHDRYWFDRYCGGYY